MLPESLLVSRFRYCNHGLKSDSFLAELGNFHSVKEEGFSKNAMFVNSIKEYECHVRGGAVNENSVGFRIFCSANFRHTLSSFLLDKHSR